jgi:DNA (cytosine-5)-methyltransferase 1
MKVLDLFSGIGGFSLGLERAGMETVAFCEIEPFCQKVLKKHWPDVPIFNDVRSLDYDGTIDVICGGFPCQPFSVAGKRKGKEDDRHLWPAMFNLIKKYKPNWVIGENVTGLVNMGLDEAITDLEGEAYTTRAFIIPACAVNAPHRRDRLWIVANRNSERCNSGSNNRKKGHLQKEQVRNTKENQQKWKKWESWISSYISAVADTNSIGRERGQGEGYPTQGGEEVKRSGCVERSIWANWDNHISEPLIRRGDDGFSQRTHRLRALGNSVVPQIPEIIGRAIMEVENDNN